MSTAEDEIIRMCEELSIPVVVNERPFIGNQLVATFPNLTLSIIPQSFITNYDFAETAILLNVGKVDVASLGYEDVIRRWYSPGELRQHLIELKN